MRKKRIVILSKETVISERLRGLSGGTVELVRTVLPLTSSQVQYLVEELKIHIQCSAAKKKRRKKERLG